MLHVTNGDHAVAALRAAGVQGDFLPWRDVLHEGPVRAGLALEDLSRERARFIADAGWGSFNEIQSSFEARDARFRAAEKEDEVVLWFEHDLYDQLQLIQVLSELRASKVSLICEAEYVSEMAPARMRKLFSRRAFIGDTQVKEAKEAWEAFRSADPTRLRTDYQALRFLGAAMRRHLEEFPWTTDGLSRLQRDLDAREDPAFLGDTVREWLRRRRDEGRWLPRWLGGVLVDARSPWRWDPLQRKLIVKR